MRYIWTSIQFSLLILSLCHLAQAQDVCVVTGRVYSQDMQPAGGAKIRVLKTQPHESQPFLISGGVKTEVADALGFVTLRVLRNSTIWIATDVQTPVLGISANAAVPTKLFVPDAPAAMLYDLLPPGAIPQTYLVAVPALVIDTTAADSLVFDGDFIVQWTGRKAKISLNDDSTAKVAYGDSIRIADSLARVALDSASAARQDLLNQIAVLTAQLDTAGTYTRVILYAQIATLYDSLGTVQQQIADLSARIDTVGTFDRIANAARDAQQDIDIAAAGKWIQYDATVRRIASPKWLAVPGDTNVAKWDNLGNLTIYTDDNAVNGYAQINVPNGAINAQWVNASSGLMGPMWTPTGGAAFLTAADATYGGYMLGGQATGLTFDASSASGKQRWLVNGAERMRLTASGKLGIGKADPGYSFESFGWVKSDSGFISTGSFDHFGKGKTDWWMALGYGDTYGRLYSNATRGVELFSQNFNVSLQTVNDGIYFVPQGKVNFILKGDSATIHKPVTLTHNLYVKQQYVDFNVGDIATGANGGFGFSTSTGTPSISMLTNGTGYSFLRGRVGHGFDFDGYLNRRLVSFAYDSTTIYKPTTFASDIILERPVGTGMGSRIIIPSAVAFGSDYYAIGNTPNGVCFYYKTTPTLMVTWDYHLGRQDGQSATYYEPQHLVHAATRNTFNGRISVKSPSTTQHSGNFGGNLQVDSSLIARGGVKTPIVVIDTLGVNQSDSMRYNFVGETLPIAYQPMTEAMGSRTYRFAYAARSGKTKIVKCIADSVNGVAISRIEINVGSNYTTSYIVQSTGRFFGTLRWAFATGTPNANSIDHTPGAGTNVYTSFRGFPSGLGYGTQMNFELWSVAGASQLVNTDVEFTVFYVAPTNAPLLQPIKIIL